jgi:hypothetical protein
VQQKKKKKTKNTFASVAMKTLLMLRMNKEWKLRINHEDQSQGKRPLSYTDGD